MFGAALFLGDLAAAFGVTYLLTKVFELLGRLGGGGQDPPGGWRWRPRPRPRPDGGRARGSRAPERPSSGRSRRLAPR